MKSLIVLYNQQSIIGIAKFYSILFQVILNKYNEY